MHPGISRSSVQRNHALIAPESHVRIELPGWIASEIAVLISPRMGARFTQYLAFMRPGGTAGMPPAGVERFVYIESGAATVTIAGVATRLTEGGYAFAPAGIAHTIEATAPDTRSIVFEKRYEPLEGVGAPQPVVGQERDSPGVLFNDDPDALLKELLPDDPAMDFAVNIFTFKPGGTLPQVEVHPMEHGLSVLQGQGVYRLDESWYPVQTGDTIWMGPYCPQWYVAAGKTPTRYLYYKNMRRHHNQADAG